MNHASQTISRRHALVLTAGCLGILALGGSLLDAGSARAASNSISVYSREDGSGTRSAFVELFGLEETTKDGKKVDLTTLEAAITNSTAVMMTSVAGDPNAIGYISLGSLNDTVQPVAIDGVEPSAAAVKDGTYAIARPFNVVTGSKTSDAAADFLAYILSAEGQAVVEENGYVAADDKAKAFAPSKVSGKVVVAGSSSVTPVMEKLAEAYAKVQPDVKVEVQQSDSSTGVSMAIEGTCDLGMASRDLKESEEKDGAAAVAIARDGIAVIVAPGSEVTDLTSGQVRAIYAGDVTSWDDLEA